jgi:SAM-dependent methyltransferase
LEFGIGTGRLALPLVNAGVEVHGVDASPAMIRALRSKAGGDRIPVHTGDFVDVLVGEVFDVVLLAINTISYLRSQDEQVRCVANAARHLRRGGLFVVEALFPGSVYARSIGGQSVTVVPAVDGPLALYAAVHHPVEQRVDGTRMDITESGVQLRPEPYRYVWPSELDLMAKLAGLALVDRWGSWSGIPFPAACRHQVSVYRG